MPVGQRAVGLDGADDADGEVSEQGAAVETPCPETFRDGEYDLAVRDPLLQERVVEPRSGPRRLRGTW